MKRVTSKNKPLFPLFAEELVQPISSEEASLISGGNVEGTWEQGAASISLDDKQVTVDFLTNSRPDGRGIVLFEDPHVIRVNFPDDRVFIGTFINPNQIQWTALGTPFTNNIWTRGSA